MVLMFLVPALTALVPDVQGQTDPPPFGEGDWAISDDTTISDTTIRLHGNIFINPGGSLTLSNTTIILNMDMRHDFRFVVSSGASLYVEDGSYIGIDQEAFVLYAEPNSVLRIRNSTVSDLWSVAIGTQDAIIEDSDFMYLEYGVSVWGGSPTIRRSNMDFSDTSAVWLVHGTANVRDSEFYKNRRGIRVYPIDPASAWPGLSQWKPNWSDGVDPDFGPRYLTAFNCTVLNSWDEGIQVWGNSALRPDTWATIQECTIMNTVGKGLNVINSEVTAIDNEIHGQPYGIYAIVNYIDRADINLPLYQDWGNSNLDLINNNISHCDIQGSTGMGVYYKDHENMTGNWTVDGVSTMDADVLTRANITIVDGGQLLLTDHSMGFLPVKNEDIWIEVQDGGELFLDNAVLGDAGMMEDNLGFQVRSGGKATVTGSTIRDFGYDSGFTEDAGIHIEGELYMESSVVSDGLIGLITNTGEGHAVAVDTLFDHCIYGLDVGPGTMDIINSSITNISNYDIRGSGGDLDLYNTSFDHDGYVYATGTMDVYWEVDVLGMWQNGFPIENMSYEIKEFDGAPVKNGTTGPDGLTERFWLREFTHTSDGKSVTTPHNASGSYLGMSDHVEPSVKDNMRIELKVYDDIIPQLNLTSPGLVVHQVNRTLVVNGTAMDNESGLYKVQWSFDMDLWTDVNGLDDWNFTLELSYGTREIYVRVLDKAGNEKVLVMTVTIDKDPPALHVLSPIDGLVTPLRTVLVEGLVEYDATVSIGDMSLVSVDGTFRFSVPIDEGENLIQVTAVDATGNTNTTFVRVVRDTTPPTIVVTYPPDNYITNKLEDQNLPVTGYTEPNSTLMINGKKIPMNDDGSFSFTWGLKQGVNVLNVLVVDSVGNQNSTVRRAVYDRVLPTLKVIEPMEGLFTNASSVIVRGLTNASVNVTVKNGNHSSGTTANREGWFEVEIELDEGDNTLMVTALDEAGNSISDSVQVERDSTAPVITLYNVYDGKEVDGTSFILEGETEAGARLKVDGELVSVGRTGKFSKEIPLPSANNTITIDSVDKAGNREVKVIHILRKPQTEPKPGSTSMRPDYFPWAVLAVIIVIVVQGVLLVRYSQKQALKDRRKAEADEAEELDDEDELERSLDEEERARPARPGASDRRQRRTTRSDEGPEEDEFDEEYDDELELETFDHGGDER
jgi:hypothetical protein